MGKSRCPDRAGEGFSLVRPACGGLSCAARHGVESCSDCDRFPCPRYEGADRTDSFITHRRQLADLAAVKQAGLDAYLGGLDAKTATLAGDAEGDVWAARLRDN